MNKVPNHPEVTSSASEARGGALPDLAEEMGMRSGSVPVASVRRHPSVGRSVVPFAAKRQSDRFVVVLPVAFIRGGECVGAQSRDLSLGGMFVETDQPLQYGTKFDLTLWLPALVDPTAIEATVRWVGPDGMGVQWGMLRARQTWAINQLTRP